MSACSARASVKTWLEENEQEFVTEFAAVLMVQKKLLLFMSPQTSTSTSSTPASSPLHSLPSSASSSFSPSSSSSSSSSSLSSLSSQSSSPSPSPSCCLSQAEMTPVRSALQRLYSDAVKQIAAKSSSSSPHHRHRDNSAVCCSTIDSSLTHCQVCYTRFASLTNTHHDDQLHHHHHHHHHHHDDGDDDDDDDDDETSPYLLAGCMHHGTCAACLSRHISTRVNSGDVLPYLACPTVECNAPLEPSDLEQLVNDQTRIMLVTEHMARLLARLPNWVPCKADSKCKFGFLLDSDGKPLPSTSSNASSVFSPSSSASASSSSSSSALSLSSWFPFSCSTSVSSVKKHRCLVCQAEQVVDKPIMEQEMKKLVDNGTLRPCPKCGELAMRDKGMCNVMQCGKCSIWWNWRTRECGSKSRELKDKARSNGSLWEAGELQYQQRLQYKDPEAFKRLLAQNGIAYDPKYVRGS